MDRQGINFQEFLNEYVYTGIIHYTRDTWPIIIFS